MEDSDQAQIRSAEENPETPIPGELAVDPEEVPPSQRGVRRRELLPRWLIVTAAIVAALALGAALAAPALLATQRVTVPTVAGLPFQAASDRIERAGLAVRRGDVRFSADVPKGSVLAQTPSGGAKAKRGSEVVLVISAGSESFAMPDVVGKTAADAKELLVERGLAVTVNVVASQAASGTVVSTVPAPGVTVTTSDTVRLTVAGPGRASSALLPYKLDGMSFVIDPAPSPDASLDVPMEVTRRLQALLEASGATVTVTRDAVNAKPSVKVRVKSAVDASPTAVIGLEIRASGPEGMSVQAPPKTSSRARFSATDRDLVQRVASELRSVDKTASTGVAADAVLTEVPAPGFRLFLGSTASRVDANAFRDPLWADEVARALYRAVGEVLGRK